MAVEVPTPTGPARPDLTILETRIYRGPNIWSYEQAIHLVVDLGSLEECPTVSLAGLHRAAARGRARAATTTPAPGVAAAVSSSGCTRAPGSATSPSTSPCSSRPAPATRSGAARPARSGRPRPVQRHLRLPRRDRRRRRRHASPSGWSTTSSSRGPDFDFDDRVRAPSCSRPSASPSARRPQALLDEAASRDIPFIRLNSALPRAARPGRAPAAHPRHDDVADRCPGRRHRLGQGPHRRGCSAAAGLPVPQAGVVPHRRAARSRRAAGSATRSSSSRSTATTAAACSWICTNDGGRRDGLRRRQGAVAPRPGHRRVLLHRQGLPLPRRRRPHAGHRRAGARPRHRRRRAHRAPNSSTSPTPTRAAASATRRCSPASGSTRGAEELVAEQGFAMDDVPPRGHDGQARADRQHVAPAASPSTAPTTPTPTTSRSPRRPPGWSGSTSRASTSSARTSPNPVRETGGAICEVNAAPGFRMHTHPTVGEPQFVAKPVVDLLFPPGAPSPRADRRRHRHQRQDHDRRA